MRKVFFQVSVFSMFVCAVLLSIAGLCLLAVYAIICPVFIYGTINIGHLVLSPGLVYVAFLALQALHDFIHNRIILEESKMIITGNVVRKKQAHQFPDEIEYEQIQDVAIILAHGNSKKRRIATYYGAPRPYFYFEIMLKNGETKWVYIETFSKRQRQKILDIINEKTGLALSYKTLERKDFSIYKRQKKKKEK